VLFGNRLLYLSDEERASALGVRCLSRYFAHAFNPILHYTSRNDMNTKSRHFLSPTKVSLVAIVVVVVVVVVVVIVKI
jgi:hypothetical protein